MVSNYYTTPENERYTLPTDCATCGRAKRECDDSSARGWDNCCMGCDEMGRGRSHQTLTAQAVTP